MYVGFFVLKEGVGEVGNQCCHINRLLSYDITSFARLISSMVPDTTQKRT